MLRYFSRGRTCASIVPVKNSGFRIAEEEEPTKGINVYLLVANSNNSMKKTGYDLEPIVRPLDWQALQVRADAGSNNILTKQAK
jgi:hypothetical protein